MSSSADHPPVTLVIALTQRGWVWTADSEDLTGFTAYGDSREEAEANARKDLKPWLGDHVTLEFR